MRLGSQRLTVLGVSLSLIIASILTLLYVVDIAKGNAAFFAQLVVAGLFTGGVYGLAAIGLSIIFGVMKIINLNHGQLIMLGGFVTFSLTQVLGLDSFLVIPLAFLVLFLVGAFFQCFLFNPVLKYGLDPPVFIAYALALALENLMLAFWTYNVRVIRSGISEYSFQVYGVTVASSRLVSFILALALVYLVKLFIDKSTTGKALRAISQNPDAAQLMGINKDRINMVAYGIGAGLAAVAGTLLGIIFNINPTQGDVLTSKAIAVVTIGGIGNVIGAFVGGLILGLGESYVGFVFGSGIINAVALVIFLLILFIKPEGLFGER